MPGLILVQTIGKASERLKINKMTIQPNPMTIEDIFGAAQLLSCQPKVTVMSCFVTKVISDLKSIDHAADRINKHVIYRFALAQVECTS